MKTHGAIQSVQSPHPKPRPLQTAVGPFQPAFGHALPSNWSRLDETCGVDRGSKLEMLVTVGTIRMARIVHESHYHTPFHT
jgi:hypothetical protein